MTPEARLAEITEKNRRLQLTLEAIIARAYGWNNLSAAEYYKAGQKKAYSEIAFLGEAGLRWANGDGDEP